MDENIGLKMAQVSRLLRRRFDEKARVMGLTRTQWHVLALLCRMEGTNQGGLAEILEVEPITMGRMIDRLQEAGHVERRADPADRRVWRLFLTPRGRDLMAALQPLAQETLDSALAGISDAQEAQVSDTLERMLINLSARINEDLDCG